MRIWNRVRELNFLVKELKWPKDIALKSMYKDFKRDGLTHGVVITIYGSQILDRRNYPHKVRRY